jgi:hypothetical protein
MAKVGRGALDGLVQRERRWLRRNFSREQLISNLKTLAWVVPLTLLIWVYAEREQIATYKDETIPFELSSSDAGRYVSLVRKQDKNFWVTLQGSQARVQKVLRDLRSGLPQGLKLEIPPTYSLNREHEIGTVALLQRQPIFKDNGITVMNCQPPRLDIMVDEIIERDARIVAPPSVSNLEPSSAFDPPTVKLKGPWTLLNPTAPDGARPVVLADIPQDVLKSPGHHDLPEVSLIRPPGLLDDRVSIVTGSKVRASLDVRASDVTGTIPSMTIFVDMPVQVMDKYKMDMTVFRPALQNVRVTGPKDLIDAMLRPEFSPKPRATLVLTKDDATGEVRSKAVAYADLPQGVNVSDEDRKRTVGFRLVERASGD